MRIYSGFVNKFKNQNAKGKIAVSLRDGYLEFIRTADKSVGLRRIYPVRYCAINGYAGDDLRYDNDT
jgi:hypothetical protein